MLCTLKLEGSWAAGRRARLARLPPGDGLNTGLAVNILQVCAVLRRVPAEQCGGDAGQPARHVTLKVL